MKTIAVVATALLMTAALHAQWVHYPTRGVPRTTEGKPNLSAPAPGQQTAGRISQASGNWSLRSHASAARWTTRQRRSFSTSARSTDNEKSQPHMVGK